MTSFTSFQAYVVIIYYFFFFLTVTAERMRSRIPVVVLALIHSLVHYFVDFEKIRKNNKLLRSKNDLNGAWFSNRLLLCEFY